MVRPQALRGCPDGRCSTAGKAVAMPIHARPNVMGQTVSKVRGRHAKGPRIRMRGPGSQTAATSADRKSTRLNSSHPSISYAVFCLKKKKNNTYNPQQRY